jgi:hypothetical protein
MRMTSAGILPRGACCWNCELRLVVPQGPTAQAATQPVQLSRCGRRAEELPWHGSRNAVHPVHRLRPRCLSLCYETLPTGIASMYGRTQDTACSSAVLTMLQLAGQNLYFMTYSPARVFQARPL